MDTALPSKACATEVKPLLYRGKKSPFSFMLELFADKPSPGIEANPLKP